MQPLNSLSISVWIFCSVIMSMLAVASSRIIILFFLRIARTMQINYFSPDERFDPPSSISISSSFLISGSISFFFLLLFFLVSDCLNGESSFFLVSKFYNPASFSNWIISSSLELPFGSILNLKVPVNIVES